MGIFSFLKRPEREKSQVPPKDLFIEEGEPEDLTISSKSTGINLEAIYNYAATDFEDKGYNDALINPDMSYSKDNLKLLTYDLEIMVKRAFRTYEDYLRDLDFHIESRKNAGLIDTVKLLESRKEKVMESILELKDIKKEYDDDKGLVERISLSYKRGFMRGLAAMSEEMLDRDV